MDDETSDEAPEEAPDEEFTERLAAFCRLGYDELVAFTLAWGNASPSETRELIRKGCDMDTAARIVC